MTIERHHAATVTAFWILALLPVGADAAQIPEGLYAEVRTNKGNIVIELDAEHTPMTVANFVGLAEGSIANDAFAPGVPFFDGSVFHRVVPGHVIQAGSPATQAARGAGYTFPNEINPVLGHGRAGMIGMANGGPHTNSNQFYVTLGDRSYLDGDYIVFGQVIDGLDVVFDIVQGDTIESVRIRRVGSLAEAFHPDTESFRALVVAAEARVAEEEAQRRRNVQATIASQWPNAIPLDDGARYVTEMEGTGTPPVDNSAIVARYSGRTLRGTTFHSRADGTPGAGQDPVVFTLAAGQHAATLGLDQALRSMRAGERRVVIVPIELGYGAGGYYAPEEPGRPRFVIRPNSTLVYEVELLEIR